MSFALRSLQQNFWLVPKAIRLQFQSAFSTTQRPKMRIQSIPMWVGTGNNYAYIVSDSKSKEAVVIDPANPPEVLPVLKPLTESGDIKLTAIVNTHHHHDHAGGNAQMLKTFSVPVIGGKDCDKVTKTPSHNSSWTVGQVTVRALHTPCHTQDSICYFVEDGSERAVFTGDTLFIGGWFRTAIVSTHTGTLLTLSPRLWALLRRNRL
jgi:glyoxylase-like metal-dependent hydrolase (beta-lactamase superfamily II)